MSNVAEHELSDQGNHAAGVNMLRDKMRRDPPAKPKAKDPERLNYDDPVRLVQNQKPRAEPKPETRDLVSPLAADFGARFAPGLCSLDSYEIYATEQHAVVQRLRELAGELRERTKDGRGVVFFGTVGAGKDHLLAALLYCAARQGIPCRRVRGLDFYGSFRDRMDAGGKEEELLQRWVAPTILAISDPVPPVGDLTPWRVELLQRLIDRRYESLKPSWVTLNAESAEDAKSLLSAPAWDRLQHSAEVIPCFWKSYRERETKGRRTA